MNLYNENKRGGGKLIYTVTLNPALDYTVEVDRLEEDKINRTVGEKITYGGKGINVSVILSRLGVENTALGFVAGFAGNELERMLKSDGITCDFNHLKSGNTRINVKVLSEKETVINARGPEVAESEIASLSDKIAKAKSGDYVVLSGSVPENLPNGIYERLIKKISENKAEFVVDTQGELLLNTLKYRPFLVKPNLEELGELFGKDIKTESEIEFYAKELVNLGAKNVLVSCGERGAVLVCENGGVIKMDSPKGRALNTTGCGDSMLAGFLAGYIKSNDFNSALKLGIACGAATAFSKSLAEKSEIEKVLINL